ncbi:MAG: patatin-like phospholipase family protein [Muribaculaceae bacterium]|nr:patatin-like phospholipase family protein [Muribaculaceae bacterium]
MKRALFSIIILMLALQMPAQTATPDSLHARKKVAVVLSGGGAFGAIHVGALKVIEQAGLPVDMLVGTSMGSIVGAFYSVGYNSDDIASMFRTMDWTELFLDRDNYRRLSLSDREKQSTYIYDRSFYVHGTTDPHPGGVIRGINVERAFQYYLQEFPDSINYLRDLPRQFACVATDLVTDSEVDITSGRLARSMRSSMSIPGVFTPVRMGDKVLVDGGAKNNFAADLARRLGADIVIGVKFDLGLGTDKEYRTLMDIMERSAGSDVSRRAQENEKYCDLVIKVPVRGYNSGSFSLSAIDTLISRGEKATLAKMDSLMILKAKAGADVSKDYTMHLRDINALKELPDEQGGLICLHKENTIQAAVGLRFDTEDLVAAQFGARYFLGGKYNKELDLTLRLGLRSMLRLNFDFEPWQWKKLGLSYEIWYKNNNLYYQAKRSGNLSLLYQKANLKLFSIDALNFDCELGLGWEHYHIFSSMFNDNNDILFPRNQQYFNYHFRARYNNEDRPYFTRRGVRAEASYTYYTDNMAKWKGHTGFSSVTGLLQATFSLAQGTQLRPSVQGRFIFGDDVPIMAYNTAGSRSFGKFFPQQMPLTGIGHVEFFDSKFLSASIRLQQRIVKRHYIMADIGVAEQNNTLGDIFKRKPLWGADLAYFFDSGFAGPIGASIGWNSYTHRVNFFVTVGYDF